MKNKYGIFCGSRCGSTHLCDLLKSTNRCGNPHEFLNPDLCEHWNNTFKGGGDYIQNMIQYGSTENEVFGIKIVGIKQHENYIMSGINLTDYIWLRRKDKLLQAISRYIAFTTGKWHYAKNETPKQIEYNRQGIDWCLKGIEEEELYFEKFFKNKNPTTVWYEDDLVSAPEQTVISLLTSLNIKTTDLPILKSEQRKIGDVNEFWKSRYLNS